MRYLIWFWDRERGERRYFHSLKDRKVGFTPDRLQAFRFPDKQGAKNATANLGFFFNRRGLKVSPVSDTT